ncbi:uncharacterized protein LOC100301488 precursor [Nasonia vitripennis]|uniref:Uncharacterized protein n=1 Tax=Nasonia vitripennis TaxID=7425 RepID=A0A7M6UFM1_NASVI|nr:uncharacterized protein LOC100301488 precursor [Nasonia vitripennis]
MKGRIQCTMLLLLVTYGYLVSAQVVITASEDPVTSPGDSEPDFKTPEYILPCARTDPAIDSCVQKAFNHLKPYLVEGIPELDLPPIEPLTIPELGMENGQGAVRIKALFTNITAFGPGNYSVNKVRSDLKNLRLDLHLTIPKIELQGRYEVAGNVLLFPIQSQGDFWAFFGDVAAIARVQGIEEKRDGIRYMKIARLLVDFSLGRARFRVVDQLNGNNVIGQAMNQFLNQNAKEIIEEMRPAASASIAKHFMSFLNTAFTKVPMKVWLHDT